MHTQGIHHLHVEEISLLTILSLHSISAIAQLFNTITGSGVHKQLNLTWEQKQFTCYNMSNAVSVLIYNNFKSHH